MATYTRLLLHGLEGSGLSPGQPAIEQLLDAHRARPGTIAVRLREREQQPPKRPSTLQRVSQSVRRLEPCGLVLDDDRRDVDARGCILEPLGVTPASARDTHLASPATSGSTKPITLQNSRAYPSVSSMVGREAGAPAMICKVDRA